MANFIYPDNQDLRRFIASILTEDPRIEEYLPHIDKEWLDLIGDCFEYVSGTARYENHPSFYHACSHLIYKVSKRHELGDGNKRSAVICAYLFCLVNNFKITNSEKLKEEVKRLSKTKGRTNEELMIKRVAEELQKIVIKK